jgi:hypothetical protein
MKEIEQKYWNVTDFNIFRKQLPELKFKETESLTAIIRSQTTPLITQALKENKVIDDKPFSVRFEEYKAYLEKLFKDLDKKAEELSQQHAPKPKK